jgi:hypothetical protein
VRAAAGPAARDRVTAEDLNVAPALLGQPLAAPARRAAAIAIDGLWIAAFNALGNVWVALALAALLLVQRCQRRRPDEASDRLGPALAVAALLLGLGALTHGDESSDRAGDEGRRAAAAAASEVAREVSAALVEAGVAAAPTGGRAPDAETDAEPDDESHALRALRARVKAQDDELQRLRSPGLGAWQARAKHWLDELGEGWLWSLAYFTLLPAGWLGGRPGQTLGKRLMGLRVAELTGKPMTPMRNLKRYGGYAAGMATGGLGLAQLLWDTNRQAIQDKTAHTVVLDLRRPAAPSAAGAASPDSAAGDSAQAG